MTAPTIPSRWFSAPSSARWRHSDYIAAFLICCGATPTADSALLAKIRVQLSDGGIRWPISR